MPDKAGILRQSFEDAIQWASEIRNDQLRQELKELLGEAQSVWESGDTEVARLHPRRAKQWVADNADVLKQPIPVELNAAIDRILTLAAQQCSSPPVPGLPIGQPQKQHRLWCFTALSRRGFGIIISYTYSWEYW